MTDHSKIKLVSSELAYLWKSYMFETINRCVLQHFLVTVEDGDIQMLIKSKLEEKEKRIKKLTSFFNKEEIPVPMGFTDSDVNLKAPKLFTDILMAEYLFFMTNMAIGHYEIGISTSSRTDIRQYFYESLLFFVETQNKIIDTLLQKGIFIRPPYIPYPKQVDFVKEQNFLAGWFGESRSLHALQITHIFLNIKRNAVGKVLLTGFSQTSKSEEIRDHMLRGKDLASKLIKTFDSLLVKEDISTPAFGGVAATDSKEAPFSDKLMLSLITSMNSFAISVYGLSLGECTRRDLATTYTKIIAETGAYGEDSINLMIKNGYFEEPPKAPEREKLSNA